MEKIQQTLGNSCLIFMEFLYVCLWDLYFLALEAENLPVIFVENIQKRGATIALPLKHIINNLILNFGNTVDILME